ncbi:MAG: SCO family protein [Geminicoccaceae bacterium]
MPGAVRAAGLALALLASAGATASGRADFRLVDSAGRQYSLASFPHDRVLAIYFGYTTCLRACPVALDNIAAALDELGTQAASVQPVFVDLDPERVDPVNLRLYMESFGPGFLGLTGTPAAVQDATAAFAVQVERVQFSADPSDYAMTHLSPIFVLRPGDPRPVPVPATSTPAALAATFRTALQAKSP